MHYRDQDPAADPAPDGERATRLMLEAARLHLRLCAACAAARGDPVRRARLTRLQLHAKTRLERRLAVSLEPTASSRQSR